MIKLKALIKECLNEINVGGNTHDTLDFNHIQQQYTGKTVKNIRAIQNGKIKEKPSVSLIQNKGIPIDVKILEIFSPVVEENDGTLVIPITGIVNDKKFNLYITSDDLINADDQVEFPSEIHAQKGNLS